MAESTKRNKRNNGGLHCNLKKGECIYLADEILSQEIRVCYNGNEGTETVSLSVLADSKWRILREALFAQGSKSGVNK